MPLAPARADDPPPAKTETKIDGVDEAAYATPMLHFVYVDKPYIVDAAEFDPGIEQTTKEQSLTSKPKTHRDQPLFAAVIRVAMPQLEKYGLDNLGRRLAFGQRALDEMIRRTSEKLLPADSAIDFFQKAGAIPNQSGGFLLAKVFANGPFLRVMQQNNEGELLQAPAGSPLPRNVEEVTILARSKEQVEERTNAFLLLVNQGAALPGFRVALAEKRAYAPIIVEAQQKLAEARKRLSDAKETLVNGGDTFVVDKDTLTELKKKSVMLSVEQAGLAARVTAAERIMKSSQGADTAKRDGTPIRGMKEAAEIELAGLTGQFEQIERVIDAAYLRDRDERDLAAAEKNLKQSESDLASAKSGLANVESRIKDFAPVQLLDEAITIRPVQLKAGEGK